MASHRSQAGGQLPRAVLLDALGTLIELEDPWSALGRELARRGAAVSHGDARRALEAEMSYYRAHHREAVDDDSLEALRDRCAAVLRDALPAPARDLPLAEMRAALLAGLRFRAFPDALPTVDALLAAGHQLAIVSNWDVSLHAVLRDTGLASRVSVVVTSAEEGVAKPDARIFERALQLLGGISAVDALHVGDDLHGDVSGALAAGLQAVWIDRTGGSAGQAPAGARTVQSLLELVR